MKDNITLKELLAIVVRQGKKVLVLALALALVLGAVQAVKLTGEYQAGKNAPADGGEAYQIALEEYNAQRESLEKNLELTRRQLEAQQTYNDNSQYLALDAYNVYATTVNFVITDIQEEDATTFVGWGMTPMDYIVEKIQNQYVGYWNSLDLENALGYEAGEEKYIREMVSVYAMTGGGMTVRAIGPDEASSQKLALAAVECLEEGTAVVSAGSYGHTLTVLGQATKNEIWESVAAAQQESLDTIQEQSLKIEELQEELEELVEPAKKAPVSLGGLVKSVLKWMVLGAVAGGVLGIVWAMVAYLFRNRVETSRDLEQVTKLTFLGSAAGKKDLFGRWADALLRERTWKEEAEAGAYIRQNLKIALEGAQTVALVTTLPQGKGAEALMALLEEDGRKAVCIDVAARNPQAAVLLAGCQKAVLAEQAGVSHWADVSDTLALAEKYGTELCGFVMV